VEAPVTFITWAWDNALQISLVASPLLTLCLMVFWSQVPSRKNLRAAAAKLHARIDKFVSDQGKADIAMDKRVSHLETSLDGLATKDDIKDVLIALAKQDGERNTLGAKVDGMSDRIAALERPLDIIQEHLLRDRKA
jgi:predicted  nucleic acid-binding Zn-ribbon protein